MQIQSFSAASILIIRFKWGRGVKLVRWWIWQSTNCMIHSQSNLLSLKIFTPGPASNPLQTWAKTYPKLTWTCSHPPWAQLQANRQSLDHPSVLLAAGERHTLSGHSFWILMDLSFAILWIQSKNLNKNPHYCKPPASNGINGELWYHNKSKYLLRTSCEEATLT